MFVDINIVSSFLHFLSLPVFCVLISLSCSLISIESLCSLFSLCFNFYLSLFSLLLFSSLAFGFLFFLFTQSRFPSALVFSSLRSLDPLLCYPRHGSYSFGAHRKATTTIHLSLPPSNQSKGTSRFGGISGTIRKLLKHKDGMMIG